MSGTLARRASIFVVILLAVSMGRAAVEDLTDVVPAGAPIVAYVADVPQAMDQWAASPLAELWNDPQVQAFFAPLRNELEVGTWDDVVRRETGYGIDEIRKMFTGDLVVYVESFAFDFDNPEEDAEISVVLLATVGENAAKLEELILKQEEKAEAKDEDDLDDDDTETTREIRDFRGIELHIENVIEDDEIVDEYGWAFVDGVWALGSPSESLEHAVAGILDEGVDDPLRSGTNFATTTKVTRTADAWLFFDIEPWLPLARTAIAEGLAAAQEAGSPFPSNPEALLDALGIESMQSIFAAFDFDDRVIAMDLGATYTENNGLIKLLAYGPQEAPRSTYIPTDSDSFTVMYFDFESSWSAFVDIMNGINPALMGMAAMQVQSMVQNAGAELDLKRDLLDNLTGEMVSIQNIGGIIGDSFVDLELQQDQVVSVGIKQRESLENAIETLKVMAGQGSEFFSKREFEGHTIFTLDLPRAEGEAPGAEIAYVITDDHLMISVGSPATLEKVLLKLTAKGDSVWKLAEVRRSTGRLPDGAAAIQYQDLASVGDVIFRAIAVADAVDPDDDEEFQICDPSALPDPGTVGEYFASGASGVWKDDRSLVIHALVLPAEQE